ncbi:MAG: FtsH protease activity modulator HflK [Gammaproteobacteria bacterium]|nr:MAG: FtsH protease activity modulator HflK [Gammaproteobacteria bacterium]
MGWNEPPGGNNGKDPWGSNGGRKNRGDGPPDLDEIVRKMQQSLGGIFGRTSSNGGGSALPVAFILIAIMAWLVFDSFYAIDEQERGVVLRFGEHVADLPPGLSLRFPRPIEKVIKVNVGQLRSISHQATMLTQDENIVDVEVAVQWKIRDPADYLFNLLAPAATLRQVTESAVREVIGKSKLDFVLTEGRSEIAQRQEVLIQEIMDIYKSGVVIAKVEMQTAKPPDEVKAAFDDAIKAREDEQKSVNQAEAYRNDTIPKARGGAARLREEATAYKAKVIARAEGEASRFEQLLAEYQLAPEVTRQRLYIDAIESVLSNSSKVLIDSVNSNSLMYLPIDKLMERRGELSAGRLSVPGQFKSDAQSRLPGSVPGQPGNRSRGVR